MTLGAQQRGMVLLLVLVVLAVLSLTAYTFAEWMLSEHEAADTHGRAVQAEALAFSGVEMIQTFLANDRETQLNLGGTYDNPGQFQGRVVLDDPQPDYRGRFTVLARAVDEEGYYNSVRFGLENESTRLNLNTLLWVDEQVEGGARELLMALPGMTEEIADAILDWIDPDDDIREFGAEVNEYAAMEPPYAPKNGPLETIEELLLVQGVTPWLLFGADANRNGIIDPDEIGATSAMVDVENDDGSMDFGWAPYLTLYSMEQNLNVDGEERIDLNSEDLEELYDQLSAALGSEQATFIILYRQYGPYTTQTREMVSASTITLDFDRQGSVEFSTILDLIGPNVRVQQGRGSDPIVVRTPFQDNPAAMRGYLTDLIDAVTVNPSPLIPGRININHAPRTVLLGIPGITEEMVDQIISLRQPEDEGLLPDRDHETWLLLEAVVELNEMKLLMPFVTAGGGVYRAQIVGYYEQGGPAARIEAVVDTTADSPRLLFWRDISHLGRGYPRETLGVALP